MGHTSGLDIISKVLGLSNSVNLSFYKIVLGERVIALRVGLGYLVDTGQAEEINTVTVIAIAVVNMDIINYLFLPQSYVPISLVYAGDISTIDNEGHGMPRELL